jgi:hypothetical protein
MKHLRTVWIFPLLLALGACNLPKPTPTPSAAQISTQVAQLLTSMPTTIQSPEPSSTPPLATPSPIPPTMTPTSTPISTPTSMPGDPRQTLGTPTWSDKFGGAKHFGEFDDQHVKVEIRDGHLYMTALNADSWYGWTMANDQIKDFYLEMVAKPGDCSGLDRYGILARAPDPSQGYFFGFSCDGQYSLRKWDGSKFTDLVKWTPSSDILAGANQTNRVGLMARGDQLTLYANGKELAKVQDSTYQNEGGFGLFIAASQTPGFIVEVDEVAYWTLP